MRISDWSSDVCSSDLARQWLSGFGGSAGTLVVTTDFAGLWTDSRYWEQADSDLADTGIRTMRAGAPDVPGPAQWLADHLTKGARVNIDGQVLAVQAHRSEEHTSELQSLMRISYAVFCLKKKKATSLTNAIAYRI